MGALKYDDRQIGSRLPPLTISIYNGSDPVDLTASGATLTVRIVKKDGTEVVTGDPATNKDSSGNGEYLLATADVDEAGDFTVQWTYTNPSSQSYVTPVIWLKIRANP